MRPAGVDVLPHVSGDGHHGVSVERGTLEHAQRIAGHASPKTTKLYDRTADVQKPREVRLYGGCLPMGERVD